MTDRPDELVEPAAAEETTRARHDRVLINAIHGRSGGGITYLRNMLPYLAEDGRFTIDLVLTDEQIRQLEPIDPRVTLRRVASPGGFLGRLLWEQIRLPRLARLYGAKVTLSPANFGPLFAPRPVLVIQNALAVAAVEPRFTRRLYWHALALVTTVCVTTCSRAIVATEYMRRTLPASVRRRAVDKIAVVPMGVDSRYSPGTEPPSQPPFVLAVGDIYVQKKYHSLIEAFATVARRRPDVRLKIAGRPIDQHYLDRLQRSVAILALGERVEFLGERPQSEVLALYRSATVFVMPSTVESFGLTLLEAMACGAPIASSRTAAMPEVAGDAALYFDPENPADIADKILQLLANPALRDDLAERGVARARAFSWKATAQRTTRVLLSALGRTPAAVTSRPRRPPARREKAAGDAFTLLFLDDLRVENGYLDCIDALTDLNRRHPDMKFRLIMAGYMMGASDTLDGGEDPPKRLAKRLRYDALGDTVEVMGPSDGDLRSELLQAADVLVRPAWIPIPQADQLFAEAASFGLPWIATEVLTRTLGPSLQGAGTAVSMRNPLAIADIISDMRTTPGLYLRLTARAGAAIGQPTAVPGPS